MSVPMMGATEMLMIILLGSGIGIPLGIPPQPPDPMMAKIAPEQCVYYTTWAGMADPDPASQNQTEQLLAEPEVQAFVRELESLARKAFAAMAARGAPDAPLAAEQVPTLLKTLLTHPTALYVESITPKAGGLDATGALVVNLGQDVATIRDTLTRLSETIPGEVVQRVEIRGIKCVRLQPAPQAPAFTIGFRDNYLIVSVGDGSFEGVLDRAKTPAPTWLTEAVAEVSVPRPAAFAYTNLEALVKMGGAMGGPEVQRALDVLGLSSLTRAVSMSGLDESGFVSRTRVYSSAPDRGLTALLAGEPLQAKDLAGIPGDASIAIAARLDLDRAFDGGLEMFRAIEPRAAEEVQQGIAGAEQQLGIQLKRDVLQPLGDVWTLHSSPSSGGLLAGWTLAVTVRDKQRLEDTHKKLLQIAQAMFAQQPRAPAIKTFTHKGVTAYTFVAPGGMFPFTPSWCITEDHLVVTLLPQTLKSYLNQNAATQSLADRPAMARLLSADPGPCAVSYQDTRSQFMTFYPFIQMSAQAAAGQLAGEGIEVDVSKLPSITAIAPHLQPTVFAARKTQDGFEFLSHNTLPGANVGASAPVLVALLLPAVQSAREAARRAQSSNNLKQIALAMHNYHDTFRAFPAAYSVDENGKPLLSWRVHILPYLEASNLYDQFHLDEPWNSEHNRKLIAQMPTVYRSPNSTADPGKTVYLGNAGKNGIFVPPEGDQQGPKFPKGLSLAKIRDGTSNTIMAVEASDPAAVIWTKPDDLVLNAENPLQGLIGMRPGGFLAALCDGSVRFIPQSIDPKILQALFTRDGGEVINADF